MCTFDPVWFLFEVFSSKVWWRRWSCCVISKQSDKKKTVQFSPGILFSLLLKFRKCAFLLDSHTVVFLSVYRPGPVERTKLIDKCNVFGTVCRSVEIICCL